MDFRRKKYILLSLTIENPSKHFSKVPWQLYYPSNKKNMTTKKPVKTSYGNTNYSEIKEEVRQGCILSPHLFDIYAERIMREALRECKGKVKVGGRPVTY